MWSPIDSLDVLLWASSFTANVSKHRDGKVSRFECKIIPQNFLISTSNGDKWSASPFILFIGKFRWCWGILHLAWTKLESFTQSTSHYTDWAIPTYSLSYEASPFSGQHYDSYCTGITSGLSKIITEPWGSLRDIISGNQSLQLRIEVQWFRVLLYLHLQGVMWWINSDAHSIRDPRYIFFLILKIMGHAVA
jgi:hypothetical protein